MTAPSDKPPDPRAKLKELRKKLKAAETLAGKAPRTQRPGYEAHKEDAAERSRTKSQTGRDIAENFPAIVDAARRNAGMDDLRLFAETYFPERFAMAWSDDHLRAIDKLQTCIIEGGLFAFAMPRASGKSTLVEVAALWSVLYGHRSFVVVVGAAQDLANQIVANIKNEVETNELLIGDFPEACYPVVALEGIGNRQMGQTFHGERTRIDWSDGVAVMPTIPGSPCSGSVIEAKGLTGSIRGMKRAADGGRQLRPDLVLLDDPQTDESAHSPSQNKTREKLINGAVLGLAGPRKKIAAIMPCTVIAPGDMVDRILDPQRNPRWNGERTKMLYGTPTATARWDEYAEIRRESFRIHGDGRLATEYYAIHQEEMNAGCRAAWEERFNGDELSAIQSAMNIKIDTPRAFAAEYQNEPEAEEAENGASNIEPEEVLAKVNNIPRQTVPREGTRLVAFVDVSATVHWFAVMAFDETFGGRVIDYGCYPKQNRSYFAQSDARPTLADEFPTFSEEARVFAGLGSLCGLMLGRSYKQHETGVEYKVERCLIDSGWQTATVMQFCRQSGFASVLMPSKGFAVSASGRGIDEWQKRPGERNSPPGMNWKISSQAGHSGRLCVYDPNWWKSFVVDRLRTPMAAKGCFSVFGKEKHTHQLFADHLASEYRVPTEGRGRKVDVWKMRPNFRDNHLFDCVVGCHVAASVAGVPWSAAEAAGQTAKSVKPPPISLRELQEKNRAEKAKEPPPAKPDATPAASPAPGAAKKPISLREMQQANRRNRR